MLGAIWDLIFGVAGKSANEERADQICVDMGKTYGLKRPANGNDIYAMGAYAYDKGYNAENNPFPRRTWQFSAWESGFEDQIFLEHGQAGLDNYYR